MNSNGGSGERRQGLQQWQARLELQRRDLDAQSALLAHSSDVRALRKHTAALKAQERELHDFHNMLDAFRRLGMS
jgi:hypothetical protein